MRRLGLALLLFVLLTIGIIFYIGSLQPDLKHPLVSQEEELEMVTEEEFVTDEEEAIDDEETEDEENSLSERLSQVIQGAIDQIFQRDVNIVAIGDSLTRGVGDETEQNGYVGILERSLNKEREIATFENFGVPGNRTDHLLERLDNPDIVEAIGDADLVLLTIGANDIMKVARENMMHLEIEAFMNEREVYEQRLNEILETIEGYNVKADIYLLGIYNPFEMYFEEIEELNQIVEAWNNTGRDLAEEKDNVTFIPMIDLFTEQNDSVFADDNFHPNYNGYYLMAERVLDYISEEEG